MQRSYFESESVFFQFLTNMDKFVIRKNYTVQSCSTNVVNDRPSASTATSIAEQPKIKRKKTSASRRKYSEGYLAFGFSFNEQDGVILPQCVVCGELLSNESLKPCKLKRHLETKHFNLREKSIDYFQRLKNELHKNKQVIKQYSSVSQCALKGSFLVSYRIAKCLKPYTVGEELILPAAIDLCTEVVGEKVANQLKIVPLSDTTVARRVSAISGDLRDQLGFRLKSAKFSIQLDESTDISNKAVLLGYVRYFFDNEIHEDFLFSADLETSTTGRDIFSALMNFFTINNISPQNCVAITTDGAAAMTGKHVGLVRLFREVVPELIWTHCILHREALASKEMPSELNDVLSQVVKIVNYIKCNALNSRLFGVLCSEMGSLHRALLLHTEIRWLSKGKCLQRVFELRHEVFELLNSKASPHANFFIDSEWILKLAYLSDIFSLLNELNLSMQGEHYSIFDHGKKIESFKKKLRLLTGRISSGNIEAFTNVCEFLEEDTSVRLENIASVAERHLIQLQKTFNSYFPIDIRNGREWIENPFSVDIMSVSLNSELEDQLLELSCDSGLKAVFHETSLEKFWSNLNSNSDYKKLSEKAVSSLLIFPTTYLCEKGFSTMANLKTKSRNRLQVDDNLRVALCKLQPRWDDLCDQTQAQVSH